MRISFLVFFISLASILTAQSNLVDVTPEQIPSQLKVKGKVVSALSYKDSLGTNYIIQTETPLLTPKSAIEAAKKYELVNSGNKVDTIRNIEADYRIKGLFVYHYIVNGDSATLLWKHLDNVKDCSFKYIEASYISKPIITDLDKNNKAEVWLLYQLGCRENDSVGLGMKMVLYNGTISYSVLGMRLAKMATEQEETENTVVADPAFKDLPPVITAYSRTLWNTYKKEQ